MGRDFYLFFYFLGDWNVIGLTRSRLAAIFPFFTVIFVIY